MICPYCGHQSATFRDHENWHVPCPEDIGDTAQMKTPTGYAAARTGLFHYLASPAETQCGIPVTEENGMQVGDSDLAGKWLADHPWDLCKNCKDGVQTV